jgi:serine protease Do
MGNWNLSSLLKSRSAIVGGACGVLLGAGVVTAATTGLGGHHTSFLGYDGAQLIRTGDVTPVRPPAGAPMSFADMIDRVAPAVVSIETKGHMKMTGELPNLPGFDFGQGDGGDKNKEQEVRGAGSGFFVSSDGYIVTNNHVIEDAEDIQVKLSNDTSLKATVVGRDVATDLAVLKVEGHDFPFVRFELDHKPRVGDWVVAMGNPFNFSNTATAGIVSAYGRDIGGEGGTDYVDYLQIDAAINRGNSGGPTFDLYGKVIGVNTAIVTPSGANAGVGFAIPADVAAKITSQLMKGTKIARGYIGVSIQPVSDDVAEALGIKDTTGAYVAEVTRGGPAEKAGLQIGDIVKTVNGAAVKGPTELTRRIADIGVGEHVQLGVLRNGKMLNLTLTAALRPGEDVLATLNSGKGGPDEGNGQAGAASKTPPVVGMSLHALTPEMRKTYSIGADVSGLVVTDVDPDSDAAQLLGLKPGDVIVLANNQPVSTPADFSRIVAELQKAGRPSILLLIDRDGQNRALPLSLKPATKNGK